MAYEGDSIRFPGRLSTFRGLLPELKIASQSRKRETAKARENAGKVMLSFLSRSSHFRAFAMNGIAVIFGYALNEKPAK